MAKAILEFDLSNNDDFDLHKRMNKADDLCAAIWHILHNTKKQLLRNIEANEQKYKNSPYEVVEEVYEKIWEIVNDNKIDIDDLYS